VLLRIGDEAAMEMVRGSIGIGEQLGKEAGRAGPAVTRVSLRRRAAFGTSSESGDRHG
jgi:hypothetical protein